MPARPPEAILDGLLKGTGKEAKLQRKLTTNRARNWLLALTLNTFSKVSAGTSLTDLETVIADAFRRNGFTDDELRAQGTLYDKIPAAFRGKIFPGKFAKLDRNTAITLADLGKEAPNIIKGVMHMANATDVDIKAVHEGRERLTAFPAGSRELLATHGAALTRIVRANVTPPNPKYTIKAISFHCNDETGWDWSGSDEPYWIFGSLGSGTAVTTRSKVFGDVDTGDSRTFDANEGCIWGQNCLPQDFPDGEIGSLVSLWEHDYGDPTKIQAGVAAAFAAAAGILAATGVAAWIAAVVAGVGAIIQWLLGFLDDDHIADQTFVFTRQTVVDQLTKVGQSFDLTRRFTDGDGDYTLRIHVARPA
jgi:hypothetical protein